MLVALALPRGRHLVEDAALAKRGFLVLSPNCPVDLFAVDANLRRRLDPQADLVALHLEHPDGDGVANPDDLTQLPCQDQHGVGRSLSPVSGLGRSSAEL